MEEQVHLCLGIIVAHESLLPFHLELFWDYIKGSTGQGPCFYPGAAYAVLRVWGEILSEISLKMDQFCKQTGLCWAEEEMESVTLWLWIKPAHESCEISYCCFLCIQQLIYSSSSGLHLHICCWSYQQELISVRILNLISIRALNLIPNQGIEVVIRIFNLMLIRALNLISNQDTEVVIRISNLI